MAFMLTVLVVLVFFLSSSISIVRFPAKVSWILSLIHPLVSLMCPPPSFRSSCDFPSHGFFFSFFLSMIIFYYLFCYVISSIVSSVISYVTFSITSSIVSSVIFCDLFCYFLCCLFCDSLLFSLLLLYL